MDATSTRRREHPSTRGSQRRLKGVAQPSAGGYSRKQESRRPSVHSTVGDAVADSSLRSRRKIEWRGSQEQ